ncbi:hypothetical protein NQ314_004318 [Rhamnusium bicolor]|uniref:Uncharacterized protein n=1 Tax=Rhamnusium bicolor TaxID=1586634 RepID=A0AAV8ZJX3_9CUCU|nr:hypothetical protein NQ314_004318 [Rhamnusium bicolor]
MLYENLKEKDTCNHRLYVNISFGRKFVSINNSLSGRTVVASILYIIYFSLIKTAATIFYVRGLLTDKKSTFSVMKIVEKNSSQFQN